MPIETLTPDHLPQLVNLINLHLGALVPGWGLTPDFLMQRLQREPGEPVIDPWVIERKTVCLIERDEVIGAAHLLRYGAEPPVGEHYRDMLDISWLLFWPDESQAAKPLFNAVMEQAETWKSARLSAWDNSLPIPLFGGIPDCWPHIREAFTSAGFSVSAGRREAIFGGWLADIPLPEAPPIPGLTVRRVLHSSRGIGFIGMLDGKEIGWCDVQADLTEGGLRPHLRGWGELSEMFVDEAWRSRGVGAWLLKHGVEWLRLAGCDRIALSVAADDEANGAGHFYNLFGWDAFARLEVGWTAEKAAYNKRE